MKIRILDNTLTACSRWMATAAASRALGQLRDRDLADLGLSREPSLELGREFFRRP